MENALLAVHVLAGILFVGPVAVTASLFPRIVPLQAGATSRSVRAHPERSPAAARVLHRVTRGYAMLALGVPIVGLVLAAMQGRMGEIWITISMVLTAVAGGLLALRIVPAQSEALTAPPDRKRLRGLTVLAGVFNLLWASVVVLMIMRPGAA